MFWAGLEFSFRAVLGRLSVILLSIALTLAAGRSLGWSLAQGVALGTALSLSSTLVLSGLMTDQGSLQSWRGRVMIGVTQVQGLGVMVAALLLPSLANPDRDRVLIGADIALTIGKAVLILAFVTLVSVKLAALTQAVGLSQPLSAFLASIVTGGLKDAQDSFARFLPVRNVGVACFFVTMGALIDLHNLIAQAWLLGVILAFIVLGKTVMWRSLNRLCAGDEAQDIGEYAVTLAVILVLVIATIRLVGSNVNNAFSVVASSIQ
jgi:monovalent cation:H+ antiporter-2, CPA2 family